MYYVPADWFLGGLAAGWYLGMFVGAGVLLAIAFGLYARSSFKVDHAWTTRVTFATVLSVAAVIGAVVFALIWII
jgi:integral membrane sensor domain MASE1